MPAMKKVGQIFEIQIMSLEFTMTKKDERILMKLYSMYKVCLCKSLVLYYNITVIYYNILYIHVHMY